MNNPSLSKFKINWYLISSVSTFLVVTLLVLGLNYNGPFIDEAFYSVASKVGNVFFITGEAYLWPVLAGLAYRAGGIVGARFVGVMLGAVNVALVYLLAASFIRTTFKDVDEKVGAFFAAMLFAVSAPVLIANTMAGYDSMGFMFFTLGMLLVTLGAEKQKMSLRLIAAIAVSIAAASRYVLHLYVPVSAAYVVYLSIMERRFRPVIVFFAALSLAMGGYWMVQHQHILAAVKHASNDANIASTLFKPVSVILFDAFSRMWPLALLSVVTLGLAIYKVIRERSYRPLLSVLFFMASGLLIVGYHAYNKNLLTMNRNLYLTAIFFSVPAGIAWFCICKRLSKFKYIVSAILLIALVWSSARTVGSDRNWPDWRPVIESLRELKLDRANSIWCTARGGFDGNVWHLRTELGESVAVDSPWRASGAEMLLKLAAENNVELVVGPMPGVKLNIGDIFQGYEVLKIVSIPHGKDVYIMRLK